MTVLWCFHGFELSCAIVRAPVDFTDTNTALAIGLFGIIEIGFGISVAKIEHGKDKGVNGIRLLVIFDSVSLFPSPLVSPRVPISNFVGIITVENKILVSTTLASRKNMTNFQTSPLLYTHVNHFCIHRKPRLSENI
mmetsp:Transcript_20479/g.48174  ORF Transcript_20479/g.48174 Transcript_20479/m.48174 type:complete len:137 (+) Transcript_20479:3456-3866(+)